MLRICETILLWKLELPKVQSLEIDTHIRRWNRLFSLQTFFIQVKNHFPCTYPYENLWAYWWDSLLFSIKYFSEFSPENLFASYIGWSWIAAQPITSKQVVWFVRSFVVYDHLLYRYFRWSWFFQGWYYNFKVSVVASYLDYGWLLEYNLRKKSGIMLEVHIFSYFFFRFNGSTSFL